MLASVYRHHHGAFPAVFDCPGAVPVDVADQSARRSSRSGKLGSASNATVTWGEFVRAPVFQPPFFVVIATFSGTLWAPTDCFDSRHRGSLGVSFGSTSRYKERPEGHDRG